MDCSRREMLALGGAVGGGVTAGLFAGGLLRPGAGRDERPLRRIVGTRDPATEDAACEAVVGDEEVVDLGERRTLIVGRIDDHTVDELVAEHRVDYVEPDLRVTAADPGPHANAGATIDPAQPAGPPEPAEAGAARDAGTSRNPAVDSTAQPDDPWGVRRINAPAAHGAGYRGEGAHVALLDTGIAPHPDLEANVGDGAAFVECERGCSNALGDDGGHGTACAGIVAATGAGGALRGVAPGATVHPVKVLDANNVGRVSLVVEGLRWAVLRGCDVANLSLSGSASRAFDDAARFASARDVVVVASAGNVGPCENCVNPIAAHPEAVAVTAMTDADGLAPFSATGPEAELAAPGVGVRTTGLEGYVTVNGTSFSAPHVAGVAAMCRGAGRTAATTRELLAGAADPLDLANDEVGNGLVDAEAAVVPAVRTRPPTRDGRDVSFRGSLPRLDADRAEVWFSYRWRVRRRWRETPVRRRREAGGFTETVLLRRGLTYRVRAHARFPDGTAVLGDPVGFRVPVSG